MRIASVMMVAMIACSNADPPAPAVSPSPSPSAAPTPAPPPAVIADAAAIEVDAAVATEIRAKPPAQVDKEAARIRADIRNSAAFAELLVAEGPGTSVDLSRRRPDADLDSRSKNAGRLGGHGGGGRAATGMLGSGTGPKPDDTAPTAPTGRVAVVHNLASDDTSLTDATVLQKIQSAYMAGIKRCYERVLATNPTASGTVDFAFEVDDLGRTIGGKATGFDEAIDTCLEAMTSRWRFPIPKTPDGTATTARFSFRFKLMPA
jgi:hypothetical protein